MRSSIHVKQHFLHFRKKIGDLDVTVAVTPNGYADAVSEEIFVLPEQRTIKMSQFLDIIDSPSSHKGIFYIQKQNSNLTDEFETIMADVEPEIEWGSAAFSMYATLFTCIYVMVFTCEHTLKPLNDNSVLKKYLESLT